MFGAMNFSKITKTVLTCLSCSWKDRHLVCCQVAAREKPFESLGVRLIYSEQQNYVQGVRRLLLLPEVLPQLQVTYVLLTCKRCSWVVVL
jgi:hypothetical protein